MQGREGAITGGGIEGREGAIMGSGMIGGGVQEKVQ